MHYELSNEVKPLKRSIMRDLLKLDVSGDLISLAGGLPASELLPVEAYRACLNTVLDRDGGRALQYCTQYEPLRSWIVQYMARRGVSCTPEQVFITNGSQQGLSILSRLFMDPGDPAIIEEVTFTGIQQVTVGRGAAIRTIPTDLTTGADVDALEDAFRQKPRPRFAVIIPNFHNPLGVSLSLEKRAQIAQLAAQYEIPVIEDDPYAALRFAGDHLPPIKAYDEAGYVFYLGSFSKMLSPALRLGWMIAPEELITKITVVRESLDLESSTLTQRAVAEFLNQGHLETHLTRFNKVNRARRDALLDALDTYLGDLATWTIPEGGLFTWVTLPEYINTWDMFQEAVEKQVSYIPGTAFTVHGTHKNTLRLNFSNNTPERLATAVQRLADVITARAALPVC